MGLILTLLTYLCVAVFLGVSVSRFLIHWRAHQEVGGGLSQVHNTIGGKILVFVKAGGDIIFLTRLLKTNDILWIGEWTFHWSFIVIVLRHLRYIFNPVPECVGHFQTAGLIAGYILPISLICIVMIKTIREETYFPSYNFFLVTLLFVISTTGVLMQTTFRVDIMAVNNFMRGIFTFHPAPAPSGGLFIFHYVLVLILIASLPSHILAAPFSILEAQKRDDDLKWVIHER